MSRPVLGIPGPVTSTLSAGVHRELMEGRAALVTSVQATSWPSVGSMGETFAESEAEAARHEVERTAARRPEDQLDLVAKRVLDAVPVRRLSTRAELAQESGLSVELVSQRLTQLRVLGLVEEVGAGWRLAGGFVSAAPNP